MRLHVDWVTEEWLKFYISQQFEKYILNTLKLSSLACIGYTHTKILLFCGSELFAYFSPLPSLSGQTTMSRSRPTKEWQSTVGCQDYRTQTFDCSLTVWCRYQWATTVSQNYHYSQRATTIPRKKNKNLKISCKCTFNIFGPY